MAPRLLSPARSQPRQTTRPPAERHFRDNEGLSDLAGRSVRGGAVTVAVQAAMLCVKLGSMALLARLLTPTDFGLVAMVSSFTDIFGRFKTLGLPSATVQRAEINHRQVSTLLWINIAVGLVLMIVIAGLAPSIAWLYGEPRLTAIAIAFSATFLLGGLTVQHQALLRRQMRFGCLAGIDLASLGVGSAIAIAFAWSGAGYWSLVAMALGTALADATLAWLLCDWRPGWPGRVEGIRSMVAFGTNLAGASLLTRATQCLDNVLIGFAWGAAPLGLYTRAYNLLKLSRYQIYSPMNKIALPGLSRLQDDPPRFRSYYRTGITIVLAFGMPIAAFAFADAELLVLVVLGEAWREVVPIFQLLAPAAFIATLNAAMMWVFFPMGQSGRQMRLALVRSVITIAAYLVGLSWGPIGVAAAYTGSRCLLIVPELAYTVSGTYVRLADVGHAVWRPASTSVAAAIGLYALSPHISPFEIRPVNLVTHVVAFTALYSIAWLAIPGGCQTVAQVFRLSMHLVRRPGTRPTPALLKIRSV